MFPHVIAALGAAMLEGALLVLVAFLVVAALSLRAANRHAIWLAVIVAHVVFALWPGTLRAKSNYHLPALIVVADVVVSPPVSADELQTNDAPTARLDGSRSSTTNLWSGAFTLWFVGTLVLLLRVAALSALAVLMKRRAHRVTAGEWVRQGESVGRSLGILDQIPIGILPTLSSPAICGTWRPHLLVPPVAMDWNRERQRVVLLHELEHVRRRDAVTLLIARIVHALFWPSPFVWLALRRLRCESERACDEAVIRNGVTPNQYALELVEIARAISFRSSEAALALMAPEGLEHRVERILRAPRAQHRTSVWRPRFAWIVLVIAGMTLTLTSPAPGALPIAKTRPARKLGEDTLLVSFKPRRNVCGEPGAISIVTELPGQKREPECGPQWIYVAVRRVDGNAVALSVSVDDAGEQRGVHDRHVSAADGMALLLDLIEHATDSVASRAVLPLVITEGAAWEKPLLQIAQNSGRPNLVRRRAIDWAARIPEVSAGRALADLVADSQEPSTIRHAALYALGQRDPAEVMPLLKELASRLDDETLRSLVQYTASYVARR